MLDPTGTLTGRPRLAGVCLLGLIGLGVGCSVYTDGLLSNGNGGSSSSSGSGSSSSSEAGAQTQVQGGSSSSQAGTDNGSAAVGSDVATAGAPDPGGDAGGEGGMGSGGEGGTPALDECPDDQEKVQPGQCGCGVPESCADLKAALAHRYDFGQAGEVAMDSVGDAPGTIIGASAAEGKLAFDGTTVAYVDLPNGIVSSLVDASFEIWLEWHGGAVWQRVFDFGTSGNGEGNQSYSAPNYVALIASDGRAGNAMCATFTTNGLDAETRARAAGPLTTGSLQHLVVVVDDTNNQLRLYSNGALSASSPFNGSLSSLDDINNWLGRSNYRDGPLNATIEEFRIYDVALDAALVMASSSFGPSPSFL